VGQSSKKERSKKLADEKKQLEEQEEKSEKVEKPVDGNQQMVQTAVTEFQEKIAALEGQVEAKAGVITGLEERLAGLNHDFDGAKVAYAYAVEDYRKLAAGSNPLVPAEAISGATIEEVKDSLDRALKLVASVQKSLANQARAASVPAGAPARTGLDTAAMSTKEKINYGLEQSRKKKD
jgi:chromosome segregation ATPase